MSVSTIGWILTGLAGLFLLVGFLMGLKRGFKKSLFRLLWLLGTVVVLLIFSKLITKALLNINMSFLNLEVDGMACDTLAQYLTEVIKSNATVQKYITNTATLESLATSMPIVIGNLFVFVILFWILRYLLWPIWALLARNIGKAEREKLRRHEITVSTEKKRPWLGALMGVFAGLLICLVTYMPIVGVTSLATELESVYVSSDTETGTSRTTLLADMLGEENVQYVYVFRDSTVGKAFDVVGLNKLDGLLFDSVTTVTVDGTKIETTSEIRRVVRVYDNIMRVQDIDYDNLTKADVDTLVSLCTDVVNDAFSSGIVNVLFDNMIPDFIKSVTEDNDYPVKVPSLGDTVLDDGVNEAISTFQDITAKYLKGELLNTISIVKYLNDQDLFLPIYNGFKTEDFNELEQKVKNLSEDTVNAIVDKIFDYKVVSDITPIALNTGVHYACEQLKTIFEEKPNIDINNAIKQSLKTILNNAVAVYKNLDTDVAPYVAPDNFSNVGVIVDELISLNFITNNTYNGLVSKANTELKTYIKDALQKAELDSDVDVLVDKLTALITRDSQGKIALNFENDSSIAGNIAKAYIEYRDEHTDSDFEDYDLVTIGEWIDSAKGTVILNTISTDAINLVFDYAKSEYSEIDFDKLQGIKASLITLISDPTKSVKTEAGLLKPVYEEIKKLDDATDAKEYLKTGDNLARIGEAIDDAITGGSVVLTNDNIHAVLVEVLDDMGRVIPDDIANIVVTGEGDTAVTVLDTIKKNVESLNKYKSEFEKLKVLFDMDFDTIDATLGAQLDTVKGTTLLGNVIKPIVEHFIDEYATQIDNDKKATDTSYSNELGDILRKAKNNVKDIVSYETELGYVATLKEINFTSIDIGAIGAKIDAVKSSVLLSNGVLTEIIEYAFDEAIKGKDDDLKTALQGIKGNISKVVESTTATFETELGYLNTLSNIDFDVDNLTTIGSTLDTMKGSVLIGDQIPSIIKYVLQDYANEQTDMTLKAIIENMKNNVSSTILSYEVELGYFDTLKNMDKNPTDLNSVGATLDTLESSTIIGNQVQAITEYVFDKKLESLTTNEYYGTLVAIRGNIANINANNKTYAEEFGYMQLALDYANNSTEENLLALKTACLDGEDSKSVVITKNIIDTFGTKFAS